MSEDEIEGRPLIQHGQLNTNDVILGRGFKAREFPGTKHFHETVRIHAPAYFATVDWQAKNIVGYRIINIISSMNPPGRFLQLVSAKDAKNRGIKEEGPIYYELDTNTALKKIKQTLRDHARIVRGQSPSVVVDEPLSPPHHPAPIPPMFAPVFRASMVPPPASALQHPAQVGFMNGLSMLSGKAAGVVQHAFALPWLGGRNQPTPPASAPASAEELKERLMMATQLANQQTTDDKNIAKIAARTAVHPKAGDKRSHESAHGLEQPNGQKGEEMPVVPFSTGHFEADESGGYDSADENAAKELLALLTAGDAPRFTLEDVRREMEQMTEEEKQAALQDMYGNLFQAVQRNNKRLKRPGPTPIETLLEIMRREVDAIPADKKSALLEAVKRAPGRDFCDGRLKTFLIRESMDAKKAAGRFVKYWEERRRVFGEDKFCLPLTLDEALRDDAAALESGHFILLPKVDASGRQIVWCRMANNTKKGYDTMSSLRAIWYMYESSLEHPNASKGVINVISAKGASLWDADQELEKNIIALHQKAWPCHIRAHHLCHLPHLVARYLIPMWLALADREDRGRMIIHTIPDERLAEELSGYGITADVIPNDIPGGKLEWNHISWLAKRRLAGK